MRVEQPRIKPTGVIIKSDAEIDVMRRAGAVVAKTIDRVLAAVRPGVATKELDDIAYDTITGEGAVPSFLGYRGFPASICTSLNEEVVHGIPGNRRLKDGDILSIDCGAIVDGFHGDSAVTIPVGEASEAARAVTDCRRGLPLRGHRAVAAWAPGWATSPPPRKPAPISEAFPWCESTSDMGSDGTFTRSRRCPISAEPGRGLLLRKGLVLAIEPMVNVGGWKTRLLSDGWTVVTEDGALSAHYEHTVGHPRRWPPRF